MTDDPPPTDLQDLARRYLDLWQDHLNAVSRDGDASETLARTMALMSSGAQAFADAATKAASNDGETHSDSGSNAGPSGAAPAGAASGGADPRLDLIDGRLAAVEERLARLETGLAALTRQLDGSNLPNDP